MIKPAEPDKTIWPYRHYVVDYSKGVIVEDACDAVAHILFDLGPDTEVNGEDFKTVFISYSQMRRENIWYISYGEALYWGVSNFAFEENIYDKTS